MFFNRFCRSVRKLFDNNIDIREVDKESKCDDITTSTDELKDCDGYSDEVLNRDNCAQNDDNNSPNEL